MYIWFLAYVIESKAWKRNDAIEQTQALYIIEKIPLLGPQSPSPSGLYITSIMMIIAIILPKTLT